MINISNALLANGSSRTLTMKPLNNNNTDLKRR